MFLSPLLRDPHRLWALHDITTGELLASSVEAAVDSTSRRRGLLGRTGLDDEALIIAPCNAVHTFFMRFAIDIVFVDRTGRVLRIAASVPAWRMTVSLRAFATIELAAGTAARNDVAPGHLLSLRSAS
ncbi:MAG TPA: DUF192 domain-containing protein [Vicinamibacterales bacterium]|jgi:uncharacterized protein|nr:DUF192 domain-containing protein [Vicinamibacterales bacterium]